MKRGEITLAVMADFSKAFDTVAFEKVLSKLHLSGFSRTALQWIASYLTGQKQFVQVDDRSSAQISTTYRAPQGSILGIVLFYLYVNDLSSGLPSEVVCHQYLDDTTMYTHCVDIAWLLSNASDMRIRTARLLPCALAKWRILYITFVCYK